MNWDWVNWDFGGRLVWRGGKLGLGREVNLDLGRVNWDGSKLEWGELRLGRDEN